MPQMILEYSSNIKQEVSATAIYPGLHSIMVQVTDVNISSIKSRITKQDDYIIALGEANHAFVHLQVAMLEGRPLAMKKKLGELFLEYLEDYFQLSKQQLNLQITVKIDDIQKDTYFKYP